MRKHTKRQRTLATLCVLTLLISMLAITGCEKTEEESQTEKQNIELWHYFDMTYQREELARMVEEFEASQEMIEVTLRYVPNEDFRKELALSIKDGTKPDIALVDSSDFRFFYEIQPSVDLTDKIEDLDAYMPQALDSCTVDGRIYGMPFGINCAALVCNKQLFDEAGLEIPTNWEEFQEAAKALTDGDTYGYAQSAFDSEACLYTFLPVLWSMGGDVDDLTSSGSREAFEMIRSLKDEGVITQMSISLSPKDIAVQFSKGNIAMMIGSSMQAEYTQQLNPDLQIAVANVPSDGQSVTVTGGEIFAVTEGENEEAAISFLSYLAEPNRMAKYMDVLRYPAARADVLQNQFKADPELEKYIEILKTARTRDYTEQWPEVSDAIREALHQTVVGEMSQEEILETAAANIQQIREGAQ